MELWRHQRLVLLPVIPTSRSFGTLLGDGCKLIIQIISRDHCVNMIDQFR